jgi:hypothetical protein
MNRWRVGEDMGSKEMDRCPLTTAPSSPALSAPSSPHPTIAQMVAMTSPSPMPLPSLLEREHDWIQWNADIKPCFEITQISRLSQEISKPLCLRG